MELTYMPHLLNILSTEPIDHTTPLTPIDPLLPDDLKCNQYILKNKTHLIYGGYEGIPENLLLNFICWIILLCLFTILRKKAWNYGRLALVQKYDSRTKLLGFSEYNVWTTLFYGNESDLGQVASEMESVSSLEFNIHSEKGYFSWIPALFKIKDEQILSKSGRDAVQYLTFQRHIIVYMMIVCVICLVIILPINFQGSLEGKENEFGHTTLSNLSPSSPFLWVHITLAFIFLPLGIVFTRRFSKLLEVRQEPTIISRTLMITHVPRLSCHKDTLLKHFQEAYPDIELRDVQFAYNIRDLMVLDKEREVARNAKIYCDSYFKETGRRMELRPYRCGLICGCCDIFGCPTVDGIEYYAEEERRLEQKVEQEKLNALRRPTGVAFVTFDSIESAKIVQKDHPGGCRCFASPPSSTVYRELKPHNWIIEVAPMPDDIYWSNLSVHTRHWYLKAFFINIALFLILFFLTTPAIIINNLDTILLKSKLEQMSPLISEFLPTLLLWTIAALMPVMVAYSDQFMSHWTRSSENHSVMRKTFLFLLFMVVILPSLGLTSLQAMLEWVTKYNQNDQQYRWECIFLPDNGAFFVNYVITSAFIGTTLELIRFPELFMYMVRLGLARSEAEIASVRRAIFYEFPFGVQYGWMLLIFAMTMVYSVSCPLITPFGLLYMIFKHLVDKYNIYFAYGPSKIRISIHTSAINFVIASVVMLQFSLLFFSLIRLWLGPLTIYSIVLLCITCVVFLLQVIFHWFKDWSPIEYKTSGEEDFRSDLENGIHPAEERYSVGMRNLACQFVPSVLRDAPVGEEAPSTCNGCRTRSYGTQPPDQHLLEQNNHDINCEIQEQSLVIEPQPKSLLSASSCDPEEETIYTKGKAASSVSKLPGVSFDKPRSLAKDGGCSDSAQV